MKLHFIGKFDGNPEHLKNQRMVENAIPFREPAPEKIAMVANVISIIIIIITIGIGYLRTSGFDFINVTGLVLAVISLVPHEILHALCFREDVYFYTYLKQMTIFVVGSEDMTKGRFVFMSLLPNIVFGFIPFIIFLIEPSYTLLGSLGALAIAFGAGDYMNVFNAITQMPKRSYAFMYQMNTYWHQ